MVKKRVLILSFSFASSDPRVRRQIDALKTAYRVSVCAFGEYHDPCVKFLNCGPRRRSVAGRLLGAFLLKSRQFESFYWSNPNVLEARQLMNQSEFDVVIANDVNALLLALHVAKGAPVVLDAHEYAPLEFSDRRLWSFFFQPYFEYLCRRYLEETSKLVTVSQGIADRYFRTYGVRGNVILNSALHYDIPVRGTRRNIVRMIHHGAAVPSRRIEGMIRVAEHLRGRFYLDLIVVPGDKRYIEKLKRSAARLKNIRFLSPVPMDQLVPASVNYDIGLFLLPPTNFNYSMALPNKFFEFIQARLAVAIGPSPEMARIVQQYNNGIVSGDFEPENLAKKLEDLDADSIDEMKHGSDRAARELNAEMAMRQYREIVAEVSG